MTIDIMSGICIKLQGYRALSALSWFHPHTPVMKNPLIHRQISITQPISLTVRWRPLEGCFGSTQEPSIKPRYACWQGSGKSKEINGSCHADTDTRSTR